ncbi:MAG: tetratricopeptide repeat protein [Candidatus Aminicenantaceae bacterium]
MVWQDKNVGDFVNGQFVSLRVVPDKGEWAALRKDYAIRGTPTVLFLSSKGEEIDRICGFDGKKDEYFQVVKDYAEGQNTLVSLLSKHKEQGENIDLNYTIGQKYVGRWEEDKSFPYFAKVLELDPENSKGYKMEATYYVALADLTTNKNSQPLEDFIGKTTDEEYLFMAYRSLAFHYVRQKDKDKVMTTYEDALKRMAKNPRIFYEYANAIMRLKMESHYGKVEDLARKAMDLDTDQLIRGYYTLFQHYDIVKEYEKMFATYEEAIGKFPDNSGLMNGYAWAVYELKQKDKYKRGIELAKKAVELAPETAHIWNTLGWLYHENGDLDKAIEAMKQAVYFDPDQKAYKEALEKFANKAKESKE